MPTRRVSTPCSARARLEGAAPLLDGLAVDLLGLGAVQQLGRRQLPGRALGGRDRGRSRAARPRPARPSPSGHRVLGSAGWLGASAGPALAGHHHGRGRRSAAGAAALGRAARPAGRSSDRRARCRRSGVVDLEQGAQHPAQRAVQRATPDAVLPAAARTEVRVSTSRPSTARATSTRPAPHSPTRRDSVPPTSVPSPPPACTKASSGSPHCGRPRVSWRRPHSATRMRHPRRHGANERRGLPLGAEARGWPGGRAPTAPGAPARHTRPTAAPMPTARPRPTGPARFE